MLKAQDFGLTSDESREQLDDDNAELKQRLEYDSPQTGPMMNLGDVRELSVPKMTLVSAPQYGGGISTRTFLSHIALPCVDWCVRCGECRKCLHLE
ncbi:hypothetical protein OK016_28170 [Vibrio chagasii]|nr:hypothetical protein [Vibrio chagasii]